MIASKYGASSLIDRDKGHEAISYVRKNIDNIVQGIVNIMRGFGRPGHMTK